MTRHLARAYAGGPRELGLGEAQYRQMRRLIRACTGCHFISRRADEMHKITRQQAEELVRRMGRKMVRPLPAGSVQPLARAYRLLLQPGNLRRLVPHDRPSPQGDLPW